ncbi:hypothetical protein ACU4HD_16180 [Cupriavidus basilensis]
MTLFTRCCVALIALPAWLQCAGAALGADAYVAEPGIHGWSGRLRSLALPSGEHAVAQALPPPAWEAGALLDMRDPESRRLLTALAGSDETPTRLAPLQWEALDTSTRALLDRAGAEGPHDGEGRDRLARLRGTRQAPDAAAPKSPVSGTGRLGRPAGTPPLMVPPPSWLPGRPGHAEFAALHSARPALVWLGTRDGLLHAFEARSGKEVLAFLPRSLLSQAAGWASRTASPARAVTAPIAPCPYPEAADVALEPGAGAPSCYVACRPTRPARKRGQACSPSTSPASPTMPPSLRRRCSGKPWLPARCRWRLPGLSAPWR